jgi:hypothetical protein
LALLLLAPALAGCHSADLGFFAPNGPVAAADAHLFVIVVMVMAIERRQSRWRAQEFRVEKSEGLVAPYSRSCSVPS